MTCRPSSATPTWRARVSPIPRLPDMMVADPETMTPVPQDGMTMGELMMRGNTVMKGYLANPGSTGKTLVGDWYLSGDLAVWHPDGYIEIKDRSKDIIISGGENISTLEVEEVLSRHPAVMSAAVVAQPDPDLGRNALRVPGTEAGTSPRSARPRSSSSAVSRWPGSRCRSGWCSANCRRRRPARSRSSRCGNGRPVFKARKPADP